MSAKTNKASSHGWLGALKITLIMLLIGAASLTAAADTPVESVTPEINSSWATVVISTDIMKEVEAVGGEWLALQYLPETNRSEDSFAGFLIRPDNCAFVCKKEVLNRFVKDTDKIYDRQTYEDITLEEFRSMPINNILSIMIIRDEKGQGSVRVNLNKKGFTENPLTALAVDLSVAEKARMWIICNEPMLVK